MSISITRGVNVTSPGPASPSGTRPRPPPRLWGRLGPVPRLSFARTKGVSVISIKRRLSGE
ncbi:MAG: hypothetical protein WKF75_13250 [Singulisphaera sp.]